MAWSSRGRAGASGRMRATWHFAHPIEVTNIIVFLNDHYIEHDIAIVFLLFSIQWNHAEGPPTVGLVWFCIDAGTSKTGRPNATLHWDTTCQSFKVWSSSTIIVLNTAPGSNTTFRACSWPKLRPLILSFFSFNPMESCRRARLRASVIPQSWLLWIVTVLLFLQPFPANAVKFNLQAYRYPPAKCIWNPAHPNALVIVTANVSPGGGQRVDVEIVDSSPQKNVYLSKKGINGETRLAITTHVDGEVGVCFRNYLDDCEIWLVVCCIFILICFLCMLAVPADKEKSSKRIIDLDVDIGADAVDYKYDLRISYWYTDADASNVALLRTRSHSLGWKQRCVN